MRQLSACPLCHGKDRRFLISCKDHTVSHETFNLEQCVACGLAFTNPQPDENHLPGYYDSTAYISHSDRSSNLIDKLYKIARTYTLKWKHEVVLKHHRGKPQTLLDFGCGTGAFLEKCMKHQMKVTGIEPSVVARAAAINTTGAQILPGTHGLKEKFDAITLWHVLEHVTDFNQTLSDLKALLNENGTMFIAVPNLESADAKKYQEYWAAFDVPRHLWHFSMKTMRQLLERHNLRLANITPMTLDAYYVSMLSEKYKHGNNSLFSMASALVNGWNSNRAASKNGEYSSLIYIAHK